MLAPRQLPERYVAWNQGHQAPNGRELRFGRILGRTRAGVRWRGPFYWQANNSTRLFEFPWMYEQVASRGRPLRVLEIGGGLSGLQFVLASEGHHVTNVDPGVTPPEAARSGFDFSISAARHRQLCRALNAPVQLASTTIGDAGFQDHSFDILISVSALEHFTDEALDEVVQHTARILRPGGSALFTVDLFLDLMPFTSSTENRFGRNLSIRALLDRSGLRLEEGRREELYGFAEFDPDRVQRNLSSLLIGDGYPSLAQCFTAAPPPPAGPRVAGGS